MKTLTTFLLLGSLALNAVLAWFLISGDGSATETDAVVATKRVDAAKPVDATVWPELKTADLQTMMGRLREAGFPPHIVRAVLAAQISDSFEDRRKALRKETNVEFWKSGGIMPANQKELFQLSREQDKAIRDLLGPDPEQLPDPELAFLPTEKIEALRRVREQLSEKEIELFSTGVVDNEKYQALRKERQDAVASVLSPAELLEYNLRSSDTARTLRRQLGAFNPSEQEFRDIFQLQAAFDDRYSNVSIMLSQDEMRARSEAQKALTDQIGALLGPDRMAEYTRKTDSTYIRTATLVSRLELPPETTDQLYNLQKEFQQRRTEQMRGGTIRNSEQLMEAMGALQKEATERVNALLGTPSAVEAYKAYGGQWIESMTPRPPPAPPAPRG